MDTMNQSLSCSVSSTILSFAGRPMRRLGCAAALVLGFAASARGWVTLSLPPLVSSPPHYGSSEIAFLPDGRFVYGNNDLLYVQKAFGLSAVTQLAPPPGVGVDPSFLVDINANSVVVGSGGFGITYLYSFNPNLGARTTYKVYTALENFDAARRNGGGLYVVGENGAGGNSDVTYVSPRGQQETTVDNVSTFSAGVAVDAANNLYVADNDNNTVYKFTAAQLAKAIANDFTLFLSDGKRFHAFRADVVDSIAVDSFGRLWASGFGGPGLYWWDPLRNLGGVVLPQCPTGSYEVSTFTACGVGYVGYIWQSGYTTGDPAIFGYSLASAAIPPVITQQPSSASVPAGARVQFRVAALGSTPLNYVWQRNGQNLAVTPRVVGVRTPVLTLVGVTAQNTGAYRVKITNQAGTTYSAQVLLVVASP
jgi:hypothetical protein